MLQSMIMYVCVRCVYIVTTKCKAVRKTHLDEHDDPETISLFYIFIILYIFSGNASSIRGIGKEKKIHILKKMTKIIFLKYDKELI